MASTHLKNCPGEYKKEQTAINHQKHHKTYRQQSILIIANILPMVLICLE